MEDIAGKIQLYHNIFTVCLVLSLVCLVLAVALFFVLDIRSVLGYLTGRQRRRKVKEMEAANAVSGRLMREQSSMQHVAQEMKEEMGVRQIQTPGARKVEKVVEELPVSEVPKEAPVQEKQQPSPAAPQEMQRTEPVRETETTLLKEDGSTEVLYESTAPQGTFTIEREIILIHTEEVI